jgi:hypothetical protein
LEINFYNPEGNGYDNNGRIERNTKNTKKNGKSPGQDNPNSELCKHTGDLFLKTLAFFNNICMTGEMLEEWQNSIVIPVYQARHEQKLENYRGISLLNVCYTIHSEVLTHKFEAQAEQLLLECQNGF